MTAQYSDIVSDGGMDPRNQFDAQPTQEPYLIKAHRLADELRRHLSVAPAQPEQEPAWYHAECDDPDYSGFFKEAIDAVTQVNEHGGFVTQLYTTTPQRKPLTDEQESAAFLEWCFSVGLMAESHGLRSESSDCETAWKAWQARAARGIKEQS